MDKYGLKILKYLKRHDRISEESLSDRFGDSEVYRLYEDGYIKIVMVKDVQCCRLAPQGRAVIETDQWFDVRYVITQIIVPILIGVGSAVITELVIRLF